VTRRDSAESEPTTYPLSRTPRSALCRAGVIPVLVVALLMLTSPLFVIPSSSAIAPSADGHEEQQDIVPAKGVPSGWKDKGWDWGSMADEDGLVRVIVSYTNGAADARTAAQADQARAGIMEKIEAGKLKGFSKTFDGSVCRISLEDLNEIMSSPSQDIQIYPDLTVTALLSESVVQVGATQLWSMRDPSNVLVTGVGMVVAVIDTGVDYTHPDLGGGIGPSYKVIGGYDFVNDDADPMDDNGHGTHCAGIVAADGGATGVAPDAKILAYKALDSAGQGYMSDVIAAIEKAMDPNGDGYTSDHADVISMSLGGPGDAEDPVCVAVGSAVAAGVVVVVAAGNEGPSLGTVATPGLAREAITVGAIDDSNTLAPFSSRGAIPSLSMKPEISAPGVGIVSTVPYGGTSISSPTGYYSASGTSMATPHVAGGAALLLQIHPTWTPAQVKSALVSGSYELGASLWSAGAGGMWLPGAADARVFFEPALVSYGTAGDPVKSISVYNSGSSISTQVSSSDWSSLLANGTMGGTVWTNASTASPASLTIPSLGTSSIQLDVEVPATSAPEGYYDGRLQVTGTSLDARVPFGFAVLSRLNVHVISMSGSEVNDPYGGVWAYRIPDCDVALGKRGSIDKPVPPMTFLLPSGTYNVHSIGHQLIYDFSDPYALSATVTVPKLSSVDVNLRMADARPLTIDLETDDGNPIYVKDFRVYIRYEGLRNVSFHITGSDYSIKGSEIFSIPKSKTIYVSETLAKVGISVSGFSYSEGMWDFMSRNWNHWFEYVSGVDTAFLVEASTDLQYLMAWELDGVGASTPSVLGLVDGQYSVYATKYDIPGAIGDLWCNWGTHRAQGGDAAFFVRRDTDTSLNPFFTGMTRTTVVQGVFSELYYPGNLFRGFIERAYYEPDYTHLSRANTAAEIYLPDRNFITALGAETVVERIGVGPFYPSIATYNTNSSLIMVQPLLRDQSGAKVGGMSMPTMDLYRNGQVIGIYQFPEFLSRPDGMRVINLASSGSYMAKISYTPFPQISSSVQMTLGFSVPASDINPPRILDMVMDQSFVPGSTVPLSFQTSDDKSSVTMSASWKPTSGAAWQTLSVTSLGGGAFATSIPTSVSDGAIYLTVRATDASGNYLEFTMDKAALAQRPVSFSLSASETEIGYRDGDASVVLTGRLTDPAGNPLCSIGAVPLELMHDGQKIGMILDEYCTASAHVHNGSIRFEWHFNPAELFSAVSDTAEIQVDFDLGIYQDVSQTITLTSVEWSNAAPRIALLSPSNGSLNAAGTLICLDISDDGHVTAETFLDGASLGGISAPWQVDSSTWSDGRHSLRVVATDDLGSVSRAVFEFDIDASAPTVGILYPPAGARIPTGSVLQASVYDAYLSQVTYRVDGGDQISLASPYSIDTAGWSNGVHTVEVVAQDAVGRVGSAIVWFEIATSTVVVNVLAPVSGSVVRSGESIELEAYGSEPVVVRWSEGGEWQDLGALRSVSTSGWSEGTHNIIINATDALNGFDQISFTITIDDSCPEIVLVSPQRGAFVTKEDVIRVSVVDLSFASVNWTIWGVKWRSVNPELFISLASAPADGYFTVQMAAADLAGNRANETFVFAMDSAPPSVSVANLASGGAIRPGTTIDAVVSDAFLSSVVYSVDSGGSSTLQYPYDISTSSLSNGFHTLEIVATDATGKTTTFERAFYVDATVPLVAISTETTFTQGSAHSVAAEASDDFGLGSVTLCCELPSGEFASVPMVWDGARYVTVVPGDMLWDGMDMFVVAVDSAGNSADSAQVTLTAVPAPSEGDTGQPASNSGSGTFVRLGTTEITVIASMCAVLLVGVVLSLRNKRDGQPTQMAGRSGPGRAAGGSPPPVLSAYVPVAAVLAERRGVGGEDMLRKQEQEKPAPQAPAKVSGMEKPRAATLLEAIPDIPVGPHAGAEGGTNGVDYGELIERELILPGREGSIYKEHEDEPPRTEFEVLREIMDDLGRLSPKKPVF